MAHGEPGPGLLTDGALVDVQKPEPTKGALRVRDLELAGLLEEILLELKRIRFAQELLLEQELPTNEDL